MAHRMAGRYPGRLTRRFMAGLNVLRTRLWRMQELPLSRVLFSVRVRLTLWYVVILALVLVLFSGAIYAIEQQSLLSQIDGRLDARLQQLAGTYDVRSDRLTAAPDAATQRGDEIVLLLTPGGQVVQVQAAGRLSSKAPWDRVVQTLRAAAQSRSPAVIEQGLLLAAPTGPTKDGRFPVTTSRAGLFRLTGQPLRSQHKIAALLVVGIRSDVPQQMAALARTLETVAPLILVLCAGGGYWLATRALRPVQTITRTAQQIGETDLSRRLNLQRRDELGQLGATFDRMLDRLEAAFTRQRQFTANASHELRTPLAIVNLEATRALAQPRTAAEYRRAITIMQQENGYMARLVNDLLTLARADSGHTAPQREEVDLGEVVLDVAERLAPLAQQRGLPLTIGPLAELLVWGDREELTHMLTNIVENALQYAAGIGTQVRIDAGCRRHDDVAGVWLRVADDGPGIAAEHLPHLCERFYRVDDARTHCYDAVHVDGPGNTQPSGSGLGLAITQCIVQAHHGDLRIRSEIGHGAIFEVWLPALTRQGDI
jgi:two-component system, OmpR family, sensor kinase